MDNAILSFSFYDFGENTTGTVFKTFAAFKVKSSVSPGPTPIPISFPFLVIKSLLYPNCNIAMWLSTNYL